MPANAASPRSSRASSRASCASAASPPSKTQGRLPESLSLSIGLHALLLLIPLGAFIHSEGEVQGRTRIELVDVAGSTPLRDPSADLQTQREAEADLLAKNATGASPPPPADSDNEDSSLDPKPNPSPDNSAAIPPPGSSETSDGEQKISPEDEASRKTRESGRPRACSAACTPSSPFQLPSATNR